MKIITQRYFFAFLLLFFSVVPAMALEKITLQFQWKHQFEFAGFYAAKAKGYYKEAGLDVTFKELQYGMKITDEVLNGSADYATMNSSFFVERAQGKKIVLLANYFKHTPYVLLAQPDITTPGMLSGKTMMTDSNELLDLGFDQMLKAYGVLPENVKRTPHTFKVEDFIEHKVDAMSAYITNEVYELRKQGIPFNLFDPKNYGIDLYDCNLISSEETAKSEHERTRKFIEATNRGWKYALANRDEIIDLIVKKYNTQKKTRSAYEYEAIALKGVILDNVFPVGSIDINRLQWIIDILKQHGIIEQIVDPVEFLFEYGEVNNTKLLLNKTDYKNLGVEIAKVLGTHLFNLDDNGIKKILETYLNKERVIGLEVFDSMTQKVYLAAYQNHGKITHLKNTGIPEKTVQNDLMIDAPVNYEGEYIGDIRVYLKSELKLTSEEKRFVENHPVIRIANEMDWPPFDYNENGEPRGYSVDVIKTLLKKIGITPVFVFGHSWSELQNMFRDKKVDLLTSLYKNEKRIPYTAFTESYYAGEAVLASNLSKPLLDNFDGLRLSTVKGEEVNAYLKQKFSKVKMIYYDSLDEQIKALLTGKDDLAYGNPIVMKYFAKEMLFQDIRIQHFLKLPETFSSSLHFGVRKDWEILATVLDKAKKLVSAKEWNDLHKKWMHSDEKTRFNTLRLNPAEMAFISKHPKIVLGSDLTWTPWVIPKSDGSIAGLDADYIRIINEMTGLNIELQLGKWQEMVQKAKKREIDGLSTSAVHKERAEHFAFTDVYSQVYKACYLSADKKKYTTLKEMAGKKVGYLKANLADKKIVEKYPDVIAVEVEDIEVGFSRLAEGEIDGLIGSLHLGMTKYIPLYAGLVDIGFLISGHPVNLVFSVRKEWPELISIINKVLKAIPSEEHNEIFYRWHQIRHPESGKVSLTREEENFLKEHPTIRVHNEQDWPPFNFVENNMPVGYSVDYIQLVASKVGLDVEFVSGPTWEEFLDLVKLKKLDVMLNIINTQERREFLEFTGSYFEMSSTIFSKKGARQFRNLEDLNGFTVALPKGFAIHERIRNGYPKIKLLLKDNILDCVKAVSFGAADATIDTLPVVNYLLQKHFITNVTPSGEVKDKEGDKPLNLGVRKDWPLMRDILQKGMDALTQEEKNALAGKWTGLKGKQSPGLVLDDSEKAFIQKHQKVKVGYDADWLPFEAQDENGMYVGIVPEILKIVSEQTGIGFDYVTDKPWLKILNRAKEGKIEMLSLLPYYEERTKTLAYTDTYFSFPGVVIGRVETDLVSGMEGLKGQRLGVVEGYFTHELIKKDYPQIEPVVFPNAQAAILALQNKEIDYYFENLPVANYYMKQTGITHFKVVTKTKHEFGFSIAVSREIENYQTFISILNKALALIPQEQRDTIYNRWVNLKVSKTIDYALVWKIIAAAALLILGFFYWNRTLLREIGRRKEAEMQLENARQKALDASKAKGDFLANMSHEIRTPMNAIIGMSNLALKKEMPDDIREYLKKIHFSGRNLLGIINDILDFSKIEAGKIEIESIVFDLHETLEGIVHVFETMTSDKGIAIRLDYDAKIPEHLMGDPIRIKQVITNFTSNAIKFTSEGEVVIRAELIEEVREKVLLKLAVQDTGKGIAKENQAKLFEEFTQEDASTTRTHGGTGLGLSISKKLTELMGGSIGLQSEREKGSTFFIELEFEKAQAIEFEESVLLTPDMGRAKIMVVDDDPSSRDILFETMKNFSFEIDIDSNPYRALERIARAVSPYDLLLTDWKMPILNGIELHQKIKGDERITHKPKTIMISVYDEPELSEAAKEAGIHKVLRKPADASELLIAIINALGKHAAIKGKTPASGFDTEHIAFMGQTVLLTEDNEINQQVASGLLKRVNLEVEIANHGQEALEKFSVNPEKYALILMDLQMPVMDGYRATAEIRKLECGRKVPIIALSADAISGTREKVLASGMNDYTTKPIEPPILMQVLSHYLEYCMKTAEESEGEQPKRDVGKRDSDTNIGIAGINYTQGLQKLMGNERVYHKMLCQFAQKYGSFIPECLQLYHHEDFDEVAKRLHTLKGVAGNLSAEEIYRLSIEAEKKVKAKETDAGEILNEIDRKLRETAAAIKTHCLCEMTEPEENTDKKTLNTEELSVRMEKIVLMLEEGDTEVEKIFEEILAFTLDKETEQGLRNALEMIRGYDFESALEEVRTIRNGKNG